MVDDSKDNKSATVVPNSNIVEPLDNQPTFLYSKESLEELKRIYPIKLYKDKETSLEELAFNAGTQEIIGFIERRLGKEQRKVIR